jgi:hypothetical protein
MKTTTGLLAGAALLLGQIAMAQVTPAAVANVSGPYAFISTTNCGAKISTTPLAVVTAISPTLQHGIAVKTIAADSPHAGLMSAGIGIITFTPSSPGATSGTATITASTEIEGGAVQFNAAAGRPWATTSKNKASKPYSFTATALTLNGKTFAMNLGNPVKTVYMTVNLVRRGIDDSTVSANSDCLLAITATRQTAPP